MVGAYRDSDAGNHSGSAYVFVRSGTTWTEQAKLTASDAQAGDWFGIAVALSGDTAVVGAYRDSDAGSFSGSAYVFVRSGTTWTEQAKLTASDAETDDLLGYSVALVGDIAVVGARGDDHSGNKNAGSAYVFVRSGATWSEQAKLTASDASPEDVLGNSAALSGDRALVGAPSGSAYVFGIPVDFDGDGVDNSADNCPLTENADQADADSDAVGDFCDNCIYGPNPVQGAAIFGQEIEALDIQTFFWGEPAEVVYASGDLALASAYTVDLVQTLPLGTSFVDSSVPASSEGFFYLVKPDCLVGSWQTSLGAEPGRDLELP